MPGKIVSFKDLTNRKDVSINGTGTFVIGLSLEGSLVIEKDEECVGLLLLHLLVHDNGGSILYPANKDLTCMVNSCEELTGEINLVDGMRLEIADMILVFIDGPIPKLRRRLPRTPGMPMESASPAKPVRASLQTPSQEGVSLAKPTNTSETPNDEIDSAGLDQEVQEETRWLEKSWCMLGLPLEEQEMFKGLDTPEKIGILVASYFCKQLQIFTDAVVTTHRLDDIFKLCLETVEQCKEVYIAYLGEISQLLARIPDRSNTVPMHGPAIGFLTQLLTYSLDPVSQVVLILDLLRTFSHFDGNLGTLVHCGTLSAVLGSMAAFLDVVEVQQYAMEILARLAMYTPRMDRKAPLRDVGIDLVVRGMLHHSKNMVLSRAGCRVLANLSNTLLTVVNHWMDTVESSTETVVSAVDRCESLLVYVFEKGIPAVQTVLKEFRNDLGVSTEGRRFIFHYAKLPQLQLKKLRWMKEKETDTIADAYSDTKIESGQQVTTQDNLEESCDLSAAQALLLRKDSVPEPDVSGILKYTGSYENKRSGEKRIAFADDTVGGSASDTTDSEDELTRSLEVSVQLDDKTKQQLSTKVSHVMRRTIKRQKSFRGEQVETESESELEDSILEHGDEETENFEKSRDEYGNVQKSICENDINSETNTVNKDNNHSENKISGENIILGNSKDMIHVTMGVNETEKEVGKQIYTGNQNQNVNQAESESNTVLSTASVEEDFVLINTDVGERSSKTQEIDQELSNTSGTSSVEISASNGMVMTNASPAGHDQDNLKDHENDGGNKVPENIYKEKESKQAIKKAGLGQNGTCDVYFFGKLVRTQIIVYVGSLVFQGEDSKVLLVIDQPLGPLLEAAGAPQELLEFARRQYGQDMTLMDLEPAIVINIIDAVRYRSVTMDLVKSSLLSLTRTISASLQQESINTTMMMFKTVFANEHLQSVLRNEDFLKEFRNCFQNATERLEKLQTVDEIRKKVAEKSYAV